MTTVEGPSSETSKDGRESTAAAIRRQRQETLGAGSLPPQTRELAVTMGAVATKLAELQTELSEQKRRFGASLEQSLTQLTSLANSANFYSAATEQHRRELRETIDMLADRFKAERENWAWLLFKGAGVAALIGCLTTGLVGWRIAAGRAETAAEEKQATYERSLEQEKIFKSDAESFGTFMNEMHKKEVEKYGPAWRAWATKNGAKF